MTLPDTSENQKAYPQLDSQEAGLGFPIVRMVVLLSLATAALVDMAMVTYEGKETGETALFQQLLDSLEPGDIVLADRYYCTYWLVAMAQVRGLDVVFRIHQARDYDFRRGRRLATNDHVVEWVKPERPKWMDKATYAAMPATLTVREIRVAVTTPGTRTDELVIATTLIDEKVYSHEDVGELYHDAGTWNWISESLNSICGWSISVVRPPTWSRRKSGSTFWPTIWSARSPHRQPGHKGTILAK